MAYDKAKKKAKNAAWYKANAEKVKIRHAAYRATNAEDVKARIVAWGKANPEKKKASNAAWNKANPGKAKARAAAYYKANAEKARRRGAVYRKANAEKIKARITAWRKANLDKGQAKSHRRRARIKNAMVNDLTATQIKVIKAHYNYTCSYCGVRQPKRITIDHIEPVTKGGSNTFSNIVLACRSCNSIKHDGPVLKPVQPLLLL